MCLLPRVVQRHFLSLLFSVPHSRLLVQTTVPSSWASVTHSISGSQPSTQIVLTTTDAKDSTGSLLSSPSPSLYHVCGMLCCAPSFWFIFHTCILRFPDTTRLNMHANASFIECEQSSLYASILCLALFDIKVMWCFRHQPFISNTHTHLTSSPVFAQSSQVVVSVLTSLGVPVSIDCHVAFALVTVIVTFRNACLSVCSHYVLFFCHWWQ